MTKPVFILSERKSTQKIRQNQARFVFCGHEKKLAIEVSIYVYLQQWL